MHFFQLVYLSLKWQPVAIITAQPKMSSKGKKMQMEKAQRLYTSMSEELLSQNTVQRVSAGSYLEIKDGKTDMDIRTENCKAHAEGFQLATYLIQA